MRIFSRHHLERARRPRFRKRYPYLYFFIIAIAIFFICLTEWFFVALATEYINPPLPPPPPPPLPTAINANFLNQVNKCLLPVTALYGYELRVTSGFRTIAEQEEIYQQGRTVDGHIVTEAPGGKSIHNYGFAVDVVDRWKGYDINWDRILRIAEYCGLEPSDEGDLAHFEHRDGLTTSQFAVGKRPRRLSLPCAVLEDRADTGQELTRNDLSDCGAPKF